MNPLRRFHSGRNAKFAPPENERMADLGGTKQFFYLAVQLTEAWDNSVCRNEWNLDIINGLAYASTKKYTTKKTHYSVKIIYMDLILKHISKPL